MFSKLSIPGAIVVGCIVLAGAFYFVETNKQKSIEIQQQSESERKDLQSKQDACEALSVGVRAEWNNVMGVTYDEFWQECVATYTDPDTGEVMTSPLSSMSTIK